MRSIKHGAEKLLGILIDAAQRFDPLLSPFMAELARSGEMASNIGDQQLAAPPVVPPTVLMLKGEEAVAQVGLRPTEPGSGDLIRAWAEALALVPLVGADGLLFGFDVAYTTEPATHVDVEDVRTRNAILVDAYRKDEHAVILAPYHRADDGSLRFEPMQDRGDMASGDPGFSQLVSIVLATRHFTPGDITADKVSALLSAQGHSVILTDDDGHPRLPGTPTEDCAACDEPDCPARREPYNPNRDDTQGGGYL